MKSVGIVTICDYDNYGNRLQNLATQEVLRKLGYRAETVVNTPFALKHSDPGAGMPAPKPTQAQRRSARDLVSLALQQAVGNPKRKIRDQFRARRFTEFRRFTLTHIAETPFVVTAGDVPAGLDERYDAFITGSDQVWNPTWGRAAALDFLTFAPPRKRIAYAASFGISEVPEDRRSQTVAWLTEMSEISVREEAGAEIVRRLTGRHATTLVDPTLMLTPTEWLSFARTARAKPRAPYALGYFLGSVSRKDNHLLRALAAKHGLVTVRLASASDPRRFTAGPGEFLDYVNSAQVVVTDSFHGAAMAILFEKPLIVLPRSGAAPSMDSRLDTLLNTFSLESRRWESLEAGDAVLVPPPASIRDVLEHERSKALTFLSSALAQATGTPS